VEAVTPKRPERGNVFVRQGLDLLRGVVAQIVPGACEVAFVDVGFRKNKPSRMGLTA
jgi:hypothetical protein